MKKVKCPKFITKKFAKQKKTNKKITVVAIALLVAVCIGLIISKVLDSEEEE